jgi:hypothetical protein
LQRGDREFESPRVHRTAPSPSGKAAVCKAAMQGFDSPPRLLSGTTRRIRLAGRMPGSQSGGQGFESPMRHQSAVGRWSSGKDGGLSLRRSGVRLPYAPPTWTASSIGRAPLLQRGSSGFESLAVHQVSFVGRSRIRVAGAVCKTVAFTRVGSNPTRPAL